MILKSHRGLIIETSTNCALICLTIQAEVTCYDLIQPAQNLSKELLPALHRLILKCGLTLKDVDYIAVGKGPGSYSGTRVGAIIGKSLAFGLNVPLIGFESPLAFLPDCDGRFAFVSDAKMDHYYLLFGRKKGHQITLETPSQLRKTENLDITTLDVDFLVGPGGMDPKLNPPLAASIALEKFKAHSKEEFTLVYYR